MIRVIWRMKARYYRVRARRATSAGIRFRKKAENFFRRIKGLE